MYKYRISIITHKQLKYHRHMHYKRVTLSYIYAVKWPY